MKLAYVSGHGLGSDKWSRLNPDSLAQNPGVELSDYTTNPWHKVVPCSEECGAISETLWSKDWGKGIDSICRMFVLEQDLPLECFTEHREDLVTVSIFKFTFGVPRVNRCGWLLARREVGWGSVVNWGWWGVWLLTTSWGKQDTVPVPSQQGWRKYSLTLCSLQSCSGPTPWWCTNLEEEELTGD